MSFRLVPKSVTLNDLERRMAHFCVTYFTELAIITLTSVSVSTFDSLCDHINTICAIIQRLFRQNMHRLLGA